MSYDRRIKKVIPLTCGWCGRYTPIPIMVKENMIIQCLHCDEFFMVIKVSTLPYRNGPFKGAFAGMKLTKEQVAEMVKDGRAQEMDFAREEPL